MGRPAINSTWTVERIELLKTLWASNDYSCAGIAEQLGGGLSRNAVIGKALRLGLAKKGKATGYVSRPKRPRVERTIQRSGRGYISTADDQPLDEIDVSSIAELEAQPRPATFLGITLINLERNHCRYPRDIDGVRLFCGQPKREDSSYCAACHRRCMSRYGARFVSDEVKEARLRGMRRTMAERQRAVA